MHVCQARNFPSVPTNLTCHINATYAHLSTNDVHIYLSGDPNGLCIDITPCPYGMYPRIEGTVYTGLFIIEVISIKI